MKMTTSWAFASAAVVAILVAGCTVETTADNSEGGVTTGASGSTGTAGSGGSGGSGTGGGGSATGGGGSGDTDSGAVAMSACEKCAFAKCNAMMEVTKCVADKNAGQNVAVTRSVASTLA